MSQGHTGQGAGQDVEHLLCLAVAPAMPQQTQVAQGSPTQACQDGFPESPVVAVVVGVVRVQTLQRLLLLN